MDESNAQTDVKDINSMLNFDDEGESKEETVEKQNPTEQESSPEQKKESEVAEKTEETDEQDSSETDEDSKSDETEADDQSQKTSKGEERKEQLNREIRDLVAQRNSLKRDVELATYDNYRAQTAEQLEQQGMDSTEAKIEAMRQEQQVAQYNQHVVELESNINMESMQAIHDFPIFDEKSPEYNKDFADMVGKQYLSISGIQRDPRTGYITQANVLPYEFYKHHAEAFKMAQQLGEVRGKQSAAKESAGAEAPTSSPPKAEKKDPLMESLLKD